MGWRGYAMRFLRTYCERDLEAFTPSDVLYEEYRRQCATHSYPCGEQTGFILLAKEMYPPIGNCRKMENGEQHRGLPGVRFLGIS